MRKETVGREPSSVIFKPRFQRKLKVRKIDGGQVKRRGRKEKQMKLIKAKIASEWEKKRKSRAKAKKKSGVAKKKEKSTVQRP